MTDFSAILEEFDVLTSLNDDQSVSSNIQMTESMMMDSTGQSLSGAMQTATQANSIPSTPWNQPSNPRDVQFMDLGFDESLQSLTLENVDDGSEQPWNIVKWLLTTDELKKANDRDMFLPPLPRTHKSYSERSFCSEKSNKSSLTSYPSEKSALSSLTLDSESESANTRLKSRRRARKPARYHAYTPEVDFESDSTLAGEALPAKRPSQRKADKKVVKKEAPAKIPRHKRPSHINAEHRRRFKIKSGFEELDQLLPASNVPGKDSQLAMLSRANDYIRHMHEERSNCNVELEELRLAVHSLNVEIGSSQALLPEEGLAEGVSSSPDLVTMDEHFHTYVRNRTEENWKFWIFSFFIRPLYYSFKKAVSCDMSTFADLARRVEEWVTRDMSLSLLRPGSLKALCTFSKFSSVMTNPGALPDEARQSIHKSHPRPTDSGYSSAS